MRRVGRNEENVDDCAARAKILRAENALRGALSCLRTSNDNDLEAFANAQTEEQHKDDDGDGGMHSIRLPTSDPGSEEESDTSAAEAAVAPALPVSSDVVAAKPIELTVKMGPGATVEIPFEYAVEHPGGRQVVTYKRAAGSLGAPSTHSVANIQDGPRLHACTHCMGGPGSLGNGK